ncbi:hypothetical protein GCM10020258_10780 [Sphingomonas yabuuchiae]
MGFLVVILGRMQLFTESTITAMLPLVTKPSAWALQRTLRLWGIVLVANLIGTALAAGMVAAGALGNAEIRESMVAVSVRILELGGWDTFVNAIPAGFLIAVVAWILPNGRTQAFWIILAITYVIAIAGFSHSIVGADEAFLLLFTGQVSVERAMFGLMLPAILGNLVGGAGLFTLLAHGQVQGEARE